MMDYYWSLEGEEILHGPEESIYKCKTSALDEYPNIETIRIFFLVKYVPHLDGTSIIEWLQQEALNLYGDDAENWIEELDMADYSELQDLLNASLHDWLSDNNLMPRFGKSVDMALCKIKKLESVR